MKVVWVLKITKFRLRQSAQYVVSQCRQKQGAQNLKFTLEGTILLTILWLKYDTRQSNFFE